MAKSEPKTEDREVTKETTEQRAEGTIIIVALHPSKFYTLEFLEWNLERVSQKGTHHVLFIEDCDLTRHLKDTVDVRLTPEKCAELLVKLEEIYSLSYVSRIVLEDAFALTWSGARNSRNREYGRNWAIEKGYDSIFFLDSDVIPVDADIVLSLLDFNYEGMQTGIYNTRDVPIVQLPSGDTDELTLNSLYGAYCDRFGFGCMLVGENIFTEVEFADPMELQNSGQLEGEDYRYCDDVKLAGFQPTHMNLQQVCWHVGESGTGTLPVFDFSEPVHRVRYVDSHGIVTNQHGQWVSRQWRYDLTKEQIAGLGPGYESTLFYQCGIRTERLNTILAEIADGG